MAHWPYNTTQWQKLRKAKIAQAPMCEICTRRGRVAAAEAVDHITPIAQGGAPFPGLEGLMSLCWSCHSGKTARYDQRAGNALDVRFTGAMTDGTPIDPSHGWITDDRTAKPAGLPCYSIPMNLGTSAIPVTLVSGPPAAGKSTFVARYADPEDPVIDFDDCLVAAGGKPWDYSDTAIRRKAYQIRDRKLRALSRTRHGHAWVIRSAPTDVERSAWAKALGGATIVVLVTPAETCAARIAADPSRADQAERQAAEARRWWRSYTRGGFDITKTPETPDHRAPITDI